MINFDYLESQIERRRKYDDEMYQGAYIDLLSVLGINSDKAVKETKGAIAMILRYLKKPVPEVPENISEFDSQLEYMLRPSGTMKRRIELLGEWWKDSIGCILASTKSGDIIALLPGRWSGYEYVDKSGKRIKINANTAKNINVDAFCFYRSFPMKKLKIKDLLVFMYETLTLSDAVFILLGVLFVQALGMITPEINRFIYNDLIPSGVKSLIGPIVALIVGMSIGSLLLGLAKSIILSRFTSKLNLSVNSAVMMRLFSLPAMFFKQYSAGELASRFGYISSLCQMIADDILSIGLPTIFSLGYLYQMFKFAPVLVYPSVTCLFATVIFYSLITIMQQRIYRKKMDLSPKFQSLVYALFGGIQKIKVAGAEKRAFAKWSEKYSELEKLDYSPPLILKLSGVIGNIISTVGTMAIYYFATVGSVDISDYMAFNTAYGMIHAAVMSLTDAALRIANLKPILDMIRPIMEEEPENSEGKKIVTSLTGDIEISNIKFRYEEDSPLILNNINLSIKRGEYLAIVGKTGCGKSTLLRLLLGFEKPESGAIYYSGKDINNLDLKTLRQNLGVVMQNGSLFSGDIFSNIIVTSPWKKLDDAWEAARMAGIEDDIKAMPMGMHTVIPEGGGGLSGGQKQRVMIARAIINKPPILFFDEATSALDNVTQRHVANSIAEIKCTRVVIAHRLSTIKHCDRIIVLDDGKIAEEGNYETLMEKKGKFYELAKRQIAE